MSDPAAIIGRMTEEPTRRQVSDAVTGLGWRLVLNQVDTAVRVTSMAEGLDVATRIVARCGDDAARLQITVRSDAVLLTMPPDPGSVTEHDLALAVAVSDEVRASGRDTVARAGSGRTVQAVEFAVDAMDIAAVRPFWRAVMGYVDAVDGSLYDPLGQGFAVWFQQMDEPRTQRNRVHFDVSVPHDEAAARIAATIAAGGILVSDAEAPAFWIMADAEGNEVCICSWSGRDDTEDHGTGDDDTEDQTDDESS